MINQDIIAQDLFYKIRSRFPKMEMGDDNGAPTFEATKGRFFDFDAIFEGVNLGTVSISINEPGSLKIYFNRNILEDADSIVSSTWYSFLKEMRKFAMKRLMSFDTRDIAKTNLDKRDYGYLAKKESVMSESIMKGTSRTSYKPLNKTRLIIRHSKNVDESIPGARSRNIESLFIENEQGERFKYPFPHKAGAEAMQRHVANGGVPHDPVGQKIIEISEDIAKLSSFKRYVTREDLMNTGTNDIVDRANQKLQSLKETIQKLARQHHYEAFKENCAMGAGDSPLIDEITMEEYKDKFTVKSFKEDIADVFPLLYKIMQETGDIDLDAVTRVEETFGEINLDTVVHESPETQFESWATTLVETQLTPEEISKLQELVSEHFPVGINGENVSSTLQSLGINVSEETKVKLATLAETEGPDADAKGLVLEYLSQFEPDILSAIGGSNNVNAPMLEGQSLSINGKEVDMRSLEVDGVDTRDYPDFVDAYFSAGSFTDGTELSDDELNQLTDDHGDVLHELVYDSLHEGRLGDVANWAIDKAGNALTKVALDPVTRGATAATGLGATAAYQNRKTDAEKQADKEYWKDAGTMKLPQDKNEPTKENMDQTPEEKRQAMEYLQAVARAIRSGEVKPEEVENEFFNTLPMLGVSDEKTYAAWDRITGEAKPAAKPAMSDRDIDAELRGIKGGDDGEGDDAFLGKLRSQAKSGSIKADNTGFGAEVDETKEEPKTGAKQIAEFILGFYDRDHGTFPLGETGVAIKVQKEFGDNAGELAKRLIEKLSIRQEPVNDEMAEMMRFNSRINGISEAKKKGDGNLANNAKPYDKVTKGDVIAGRLGKDEEGGKKKMVKESVDFTDMLILSGLRK
jgi:hypothetical protein